MDAPTEYDLLSQRLSLLDVHVPTPYAHLPKESGIKGKVSWAKSNVTNYMWNARHMFELAKIAGLPGMDEPANAWSPKVLGTTSVSPNAYISTFRDLALDRYVTLNQAKAQGDVRTISQICSGAFAAAAKAHVTRRMPNVSFDWKIQKEVTPTQCVSVRTLGGLDPKMGRRRGSYAQILVKFDTEQSLTIHNKAGKLIKDDGAHRVIEYLVFERKFWEETGPWLIRDQLYEAV
jgi:hypothetical protein